MQPASDSRPSRRRLLRSAAGLAALPFAAEPGAAQGAPDPVRFTLEFRTYGPNSPAYLGIDKGIWRSLNIAPTIDGSGGSNDAVTRIASGAYDAGYADLSTLVDFAARNPAAAPVMVMPLFDRFPAAVISLKPVAIKSLADLKGLRLGMATTDAGSKILPALLRSKGVEPSSFRTMTVDVKLRDTMLMRREVDAVVGFDYTTIFNLLGAGIKLDDINLLYFSSLGFDFVGTALLVSRPLLERNPDLVRRIALASTRCFVTAFGERAASIEAVVKRERLLDPAIERQRMDWVFDRLILTDNVKANGLGAVSTERLQSGITTLAEGFGFSKTPDLSSVYVPAFMPIASERRVA